MLMRRYGQIATTNEKKAAYLVFTVTTYILTLHSLFYRVSQMVK